MTSSACSTQAAGLFSKKVLSTLTIDVSRRVRASAEISSCPQRSEKCPPPSPLACVPGSGVAPMGAAGAAPVAPAASSFCAPKRGTGSRSARPASGERCCGCCCAAGGGCGAGADGSALDAWLACDGVNGSARSRSSASSGLVPCKGRQHRL